MTFLNPAILWALAAVSIPIIIHIFNLKKTKKIEFSTLMFLKEIQQSKYKKIKLKQLLILLCRIAFIILLVMMFAKPFTKGSLGSTGEKARSTVLIILDDSFSMQSRETSGNNFESAKAKIIETLNVLDPNDEVFFTTVSQVNRLDKNMLYKNISRLRDTLAAIKTSDVSKSMNEVLFFAKEILKSSSHSYREVYIFTDGQKSFIENPNIISDGLKPDEQTKLNIVLIGNRTPNNLSLDTINTITRIFEKNKPVKLRASVNNHNNFNVLNKSVVISFGSFKDEKAIDIPANSTVDVEFILNPGVTGYAGGSIELVQNEISDDEISSDNKQFFSFLIPEKISLLLVSGSPGDVQFINLALTSSEELMKDSLGTRTKYFDVKQVSAGELMNQDLKSFNAVVIANKQQFTQAESQMLKAHIEEGGGVIVYPGSTTQSESYNTLLTEMDIPNANGNFGNDNSSFTFDKIDLEHPIFEGIFKQGSTQKNVNIESPIIRSGLNLSSGRNAIPLITLNNEKNFLVEYSKGKGKLLLFAVPPDMSRSDYPAKNLFSPITVRSILYLSNINNVKPAITGKDFFADLELPAGTDTLSITSTSGAAPVKIGITPGSDALLNLKNNIDNTANYTVSAAGNAVFQFPANFVKTESETSRLAGNELEAYLKDRLSLEANIITPQETIAASVLELRTGKDLWQYFLLAGLLFIIIEYFLARSLIRSKNDKI